MTNDEVARIAHCAAHGTNPPESIAALSKQAPASSMPLVDTTMTNTGPQYPTNTQNSVNNNMAPTAGFAAQPGASQEQMRATEDFTQWVKENEGNLDEFMRGWDKMEFGEAGHGQGHSQR